MPSRLDVEDENGLRLVVHLEQEAVSAFAPAVVAVQIRLQVNDRVVALVATRIACQFGFDFLPAVSKIAVPADEPPDTPMLFDRIFLTYQYGLSSPDGSGVYAEAASEY